MRNFLFLLLAGWSLSVAAQAVPFAKGRAAITPPPGYTHSLHDNGDTIALRPKNGLFEARFTYYAVPVSKDRPQLAREFVIETARKKEKQVTQFRGGKSVGFIERGASLVLDGVEHRTLNGLLTLGQGYVELLLLVPESNVNLPEMREFMKNGMEPLIAALQARGKP